MKKNRLILLLSSTVILIGALITWFVIYYEINAREANGKSVLYLRVSPGESVESLAPELRKVGIINSTLSFKIYLHLHATPKISPGFYRFYKPSNYGYILSEFSLSPKRWEVNVYPGLSSLLLSKEVSKITGRSAVSFLNDIENPKIRSPYEPANVNSLEGLLGAGSYFISPGEGNSEIIQEMVNVFNGQAKAVGLYPGRTYQNGLSAYQEIIAASIAVSEAKYPDDETMVDRVILNRLQENMKLQMDSTVCYGLGHPGCFPTFDEINSLTSPYNTYRYFGLPPTPIAFVSSNDLKLALNPPVGNWLYFVVVTKDGHEAFSSTYAGQLANEELAKKRNVPS